MCVASSVEALSFLRKSVASVVTKEDVVQFNSLPVYLFNKQGIFTKKIKK